MKADDQIEGDHTKDREFLANMQEEEFNKYKGEWVAVANAEIVAHGKDPYRVREEGRMAGKGEPLVDRIDEPTDEPIIFTSGYLVG